MCALLQIGIYLAYPTSSVLKSIYRPKNYKTKVNNQHTKVGIAKEAFDLRKKGYTSNFDGEVEFLPLARIPQDNLKRAEDAVLTAIVGRGYKKVGRAREWFDTDERIRLQKIIFETLEDIRCPHQRIG